MSDHLKFWHCDFCHKGLTASDLHDITDHKVRCHSCFEKQQASDAKRSNDMSSNLSKRLQELINSGDDESLVNWVIDHQGDICNALDVWSAPKPKAQHVHHWISEADGEAHCDICGASAAYPA